MPLHKTLKEKDHWRSVCHTAQCRRPDADKHGLSKICSSHSEAPRDLPGTSLHEVGNRLLLPLTHLRGR